MDEVKIMQVVVTRLTTAGSGRDGSPIRKITQVWSPDGEFIADNDPHRHSECCHLRAVESELHSESVYVLKTNLQDEKERNAKLISSEKQAQETADSLRRHLAEVKEDKNRNESLYDHAQKTMKRREEQMTKLADDLNARCHELSDLVVEAANLLPPYARASLLRRAGVKVPKLKTKPKAKKG